MNLNFIRHNFISSFSSTVSAMTYFYGIYHYSFVNISKLIFCMVTAVTLHIPFLYTKGDFSVSI